MDIAPTLTMYRGTNQEFATKYMWWFFLIQPFPLPEHMIGRDAGFYLQEVFGGLNKTPGAIAPDVDGAGVLCPMPVPHAIAAHQRRRGRQISLLRANRAMWSAARNASA
jgi:hypothetical protein